MKLATLLSGGKDSLYATYIMMQKGFDVKYIITMIPKNPDSFMYHVPNTRFVKYQARAMRIPIIEKNTRGEKEKELEDLKSAIKKIKNKIDGVVSGAVLSDYQFFRINMVCEELGLRSFTPLWRKNPISLLRELTSFEIIITAVAAQGLDEKWLGRKLDEKCIHDLIKLSEKYKISPMGEGGEIESFVLDCPLFKERLKIVKAENVWNEKNRNGFLDIKKIKSIKKYES